MDVCNMQMKAAAHKKEKATARATLDHIEWKEQGEKATQ